jgi:hypothetical protein
MSSRPALSAMRNWALLPASSLKAPTMLSVPPLVALAKKVAPPKGMMWVWFAAEVPSWPQPATV